MKAAPRSPLPLPWVERGAPSPVLRYMGAGKGDGSSARREHGNPCRAVVLADQVEDQPGAAIIRLAWLRPTRPARAALTPAVSAPARVSRPALAVTTGARGTQPRPDPISEER